jgi:hypothetical protein
MVSPMARDVRDQLRVTLPKSGLKDAAGATSGDTTATASVILTGAGASTLGKLTVKTSQTVAEEFFEWEGAGEPDSHPLSIYQALASGANGARQLSAPLAASVTIVISPTNENGLGNVGFFYGGAVYCNSGRTG